MQQIEGLRHVFPKGSVCLSDDGVMVFYTYHDGWFTDEIKDDNKVIFECLIDNCTTFGVQYIAGKFIKIIFTIEGISDKLVFYKPLDSQAQLKDIHELLKEFGVSEELLDFLAGEETIDESNIIGKMAEWVVLKNREFDSKESVKLQSVANWENIRNLTQEIVNYCNGEAELLAPGVGNDGSCELRFPEGNTDVIWFDKNGKDAFLKLVKESSLITIEGNVSFGFLNIGFYI